MSLSFFHCHLFCSFLLDTILTVPSLSAPPTLSLLISIGRARPRHTPRHATLIATTYLRYDRRYPTSHGTMVLRPDPIHGARGLPASPQPEPPLPDEDSIIYLVGKGSNYKSVIYDILLDKAPVTEPEWNEVGVIYKHRDVVEGQASEASKEVEGGRNSGTCRTSFMEYRTCNCFTSHKQSCQ